MQFAACLSVWMTVHYHSVLHYCSTLLAVHYCWDLDFGVLLFVLVFLSVCLCYVGQCWGFSLWFSCGFSCSLACDDVMQHEYPCIEYVLRKCGCKYQNCMVLCERFVDWDEHTHLNEWFKKKMQSSCTNLWCVYHFAMRNVFICFDEFYNARLQHSSSCGCSRSSACHHARFKQCIKCVLPKYKCKYSHSRREKLKIRSKDFQVPKNAHAAVAMLGIVTKTARANWCSRKPWPKVRNSFHATVLKPCCGRNNGTQSEILLN
jgi:hypothetical protein